MTGAPPLAPDAPAPLTRRDLLALLLVTLAALGVRLVGLGEQPLWLDEATTAAFAARPLPQALTAEVHHPPLHYLLTHVAIETLAPAPAPAHVEGIPDDVVRGAAASNALLRLPALIPGVLLIPALAFLTRRLAPGGRARAAFHAAALLAALSPFGVAMSQEARNYALYMLLAVLATHLFLGLLRRGTGTPRLGVRLAAYALLSTLLMYTHHVAAVVLLAHEALYWVAWARARRAGGTPVGAGRWLLARAASAAAFLPWMLWVAHQVASGAARFEARHWVGVPQERIPYSLFRFLAGYGLGPENADAMDLPRAELLAREGPVALLVMAPLLLLLVLGLRARCWRPGLRGPLVVTLLFAYALLLPLSPWVKMIHERYLCFQGPLLLAVAALGAAALGVRGRWLALGSAVVASLFALGAAQPSVRPHLGLSGVAGKEAWDQAAAFVREQEADVVLLAPAFLFLSFDRAWLQRDGGSGAQPERHGWPAHTGGPDGRDSDGIPLPAMGRRVAVVASRLAVDEPRLLQAFAPYALLAERWFPQQSGIRVRIYEFAR